MRRSFLIVLTICFCSYSIAQNLDIRLLNAINSPGQLKADGYNKFMSNTYLEVLGAVPITMGITGLVRHDREMVRNACVMVSSIAVAEGITFVLKYSVNRQRPFDKYSFISKKVDVNDPSFPSGHSSGTFALATSLSLAYPKWYVIVPSFAYASSVAFSRMYLGVHYPSDVLGGMIIGVGGAWVSYKANKWLTKKYEEKHAKQL